MHYDIFANDNGRTLSVFGKRLREVRIARNVIIDQIATACNVARTTVITWEKGLGQPSLRRFLLLCKFLDVSADYLLRDVDTE